MNDTSDLAIALRHLVQQHGVPAVLQTLALVMGDTGNVTGGVVSEVAAVEEWLASQPGQGERQ